MQKHQEWLDNRTYAQHLQHLQKIRIRKSRQTTAISTSNPRKKRTRQLENENKYFQQNKQNQDFFQHTLQTPGLQADNRFYTGSRNTSRQTEYQGQQQKNEIQGRSVASRFAKQSTHYGTLKKAVKYQHPIDPSSISLKEKNLLWQNFLIGKRIIETPPVICKRKLDSDYNKHLRLLRSRRKPQFQSNFREKKLKQYNEKTIRIADDIRVHLRSCKYVLILNIKDIIINKRKPCMKDLQLSLSYISRLKQPQIKNQTTLANLRFSERQFSQQVHMSVLNDYNFYFSVNKKHIRSQMFAFVQIRELKGLSYLAVGAFCLPINEKLTQGFKLQALQLSKAGKCIGHIDVQTRILKKSDIIESNSYLSCKNRISQQRVFRTQTNTGNQKKRMDVCS